MQEGASQVFLSTSCRWVMCPIPFEGDSVSNVSRQGLEP